MPFLPTVVLPGWRVCQPIGSAWAAAHVGGGAFCGTRRYSHGRQELGRVSKPPLAKSPLGPRGGTVASSDHRPKPSTCDDVSWSSGPTRVTLRPSPNAGNGDTDVAFVAVVANTMEPAPSASERGHRLSTEASSPATRIGVKQTHSHVC